MRRRRRTHPWRSPRKVERVRARRRVATARDPPRRAGSHARRRPTERRRVRGRALLRTRACLVVALLAGAPAAHRAPPSRARAYRPNPTVSGLRHTRSRSAILASTHVRMRRGRRETESEEEMPRGGRLAGSAETRVRLFGQMVEWSYGY